VIEKSHGWFVIQADNG